jgi:hypothetical protein
MLEAHREGSNTYIVPHTSYCAKLSTSGHKLEMIAAIFWPRSFSVGNNTRTTCIVLPRRSNPNSVCANFGVYCHNIGWLGHIVFVKVLLTANIIGNLALF